MDHVTNCNAGKQHDRTKPSKRVRTRTRKVRRGENWEGEKAYRRLQRYQATLRRGGEPSDYELGEGETEGAGFSEESGVETDEEYLVELGEGEPSEEEEEKKKKRMRKRMRDGDGEGEMRWIGRGTGMGEILAVDEVAVPSDKDCCFKLFVLNTILLLFHQFCRLLYLRVTSSPRHQEETNSTKFGVPAKSQAKGSGGSGFECKAYLATKGIRAILRMYEPRAYLAGNMLLRRDPVFRKCGSTNLWSLDPCRNMFSLSHRFLDLGKHLAPGLQLHVTKAYQLYNTSSIRQPKSGRAQELDTRTS